MERVTLLSAEAIIDLDTLARLRLPRPEAATPAESTPALGAGASLDEAAQIRQVLQQTGGNMVQAVRLLGLSRSTLRYRVIRCGLSSAVSGKTPAPRAAHQDAPMPQREGSSG
ncbi:MAG: helix-turn-helix domain-containing protein [Candidatus Entotheonellia bacterium]